MNPTLHLCLTLLLPWVAAHALPQQAVSLQRQDQTSSLRWLMRPRLALAGVRPSSRPVLGVQRPATATWARRWLGWTIWLWW